MTAGRLTTPLVRDNGELRPATWDEALDRVAEGFGRARANSDTTTSFGIFSLLEGLERDELPGRQAGPAGDGVEQHRLLQPHLTRT